MPNFYNIPASLPFADTLARHIIKRFGNNQIQLADIILLLPNRRSCRSVQEAFLRVTNGKPTLLPRMQPLGDVGDDGFTLKLSLGNIPPSISPVISSSQQRLLLAQLIEKWQSTNVYTNKTSTAQSVNLAADLATFLDEVQRQQLPFDRLRDIVPEELAKHWQITLDFMEIIIRLWPEILKEKGSTDIGTYRNLALNNLSKFWQENPPSYPVIAAGSTASIPATAKLLKTIASLPNGAVILPGVDMIMDEESWESIEETHFQCSLRSFLESNGIKRSDIKNLDKDVLTERAKIISQMMLPATSSYKWQTINQISPDAIKGISRIDAPTLQDEARIIAVILRHTLETPGKTAALVTNDSSLATRTKSIMEKWDIKLDTSGGTPLAEVPACIFMRLVSAMVEEKFSPIKMLSCLKHPLACAGAKIGSFKGILREIEKNTMRGIAIPGGISGLKNALAKQAGIMNFSKHIALLDNIEEIFRTFTRLMEQKSVKLSDLISEHIKAAEDLASTNELTGAEHLWGNDEGLALKEFFNEFLEASDEIEYIKPSEYTGILEAILAGKTYHPKYGNHPRITILSPMEARMQSFDLVILGSLNEGSWPPMVEAGSWMSRPMRKSFGLPLPEKQIGQSAHDFVQLLHQPNVILTRSEKIDGTATIASRWLMRLDAILGTNSKELLKPEFPWDIWAKELERPEYITPAKPPSPTPPDCARPLELSVTQVEKLMRNPYAHYSEKILRLKKLDQIDMETSNREFGSIIHKAIELLVQSYERIPEDGHFQFLQDIWQRLLEENHIPSTIQAFWNARFKKISQELVELEKRRRKNLKHIHSEVKGTLPIKLENGKTLVVTARADRLEIKIDGTISIIDYKTKGNISSIAKSMQSGTLPQMPLEALIVNNHGFEGVNGAVTDMEYWFITGGNDKDNAIKEEKISDKLSRAKTSLEDILEVTKTGITELAEIFTNPATPYLAAPNPENEPDYNDYEHLARKKEWL